MGVKWTREQEQVIRLRGKNLLVSAAAGSGKTAVLVERILSRVMDPQQPIDVDELLIVTFTRAAAGEMRERIGQALQRAIEEDPDNDHLQRQQTLLHHAQINTIHGFCSYVIQNYFQMIDLDPAYRMAEDGEIRLLRSDVVKEVLEEGYTEQTPEFENFIECYAAGKTDEGIEDLILNLFDFASSYPWPEEWLTACETELENCEEERLMETEWMHFLMWDVAMQTGELCAQLEEAVTVCEEENGPTAYIPMLTSDLRMLREIGKAEDYASLNELLGCAAFDRLASIRSKDIDADKKAFVTGCRDRVKKAVGKLRDLYCFESMETVVRDMRGTAGAVRMLLKLAGEFNDRYQAAKQEKNLVDFGDLEHYALEVLLEKPDGESEECAGDSMDDSLDASGRRPSAVADELSRQFEEILVDEYQDSNDVQETLIHAISRERFGTPNVFMVGDVKQSIYKFRLARPELFLKKYESYPREEGQRPFRHQ